MTGAERGTIDDVIVPHSIRRRTQTSLRSLRKQNHARELAMLRKKSLDMAKRKHDNLPL